MDEIQKQLNEISSRLSALEDRVPAGLEGELSDMQRSFLEIAKAAGPAVSNSPTANGYMPFFINGQRINLITGS